MKNKLWVAPLALTFALGACDDMLEEKPVSFITTATYYNTADDLEKGMLSGWGSLRSVFPGTYNGFTGFMGNMSDQERADPNEVNSPRNVAGLDWTASSMQGLDVGWQNLYRVIYRENIVLSRVDNATGDAARKAAIAAEAKFLRAYSYMWLDRMHSAGPKLTDPSASTAVADASPSRCTVNEAPVLSATGPVVRSATKCAPPLSSSACRASAARSFGVGGSPLARSKRCPQPAAASTTTSATRKAIAERKRRTAFPISAGVCLP